MTLPVGREREHKRAKVSDLDKHGTSESYKRGCRCPDCYHYKKMVNRNRVQGGTGRGTFGNSKHVCPRCSQSFSTDELYKTHWKATHGDKR